MSNLGKSVGFFSIDNSDTNIGSLFTLDDTLYILEIEKDEVPNIKTYLERLKVMKDDYVDEAVLSKHFSTIKTMFSKTPTKAKTSLDEYVLMAIMRKSFPGISIIQQPKVLGNKHCDFLITYEGKSFYIEFDGPGHFISDKKLDDPFIRSEQIYKETGVEVVRWPFWIQRCAQNIRAILYENEKGYGALWSSNAHFSEFTIDNAENIVKKMNRRFKADDSGIGYFYESGKDGRNKPEHPIIKKITSGKQDVSILYPKNAQDINYWLPDCLKK